MPHTPDEGDCILRIRGLTKRFERAGQPFVALDNVDLDVADGEFVTLVGPSGCGKTTLLRIVQGLIEASAGTVEIGGVRVTRPSGDRGFVFQQDNLYPWRTVRRNVVLGLELAGADRGAALRRAQAMIDLVGLRGFEESYPRELSGGMRQRVNLARALAIDPKVLLMDEPFAALDAITRESMQHELLRIWRQAGKTVLFVTHQIDEAVYLANRVVVLAARPGRIARIVPITASRERNAGWKRDPAFHAAVDEIRALIEENERQGAAA